MSACCLPVRARTQTGAYTQASLCCVRHRTGFFILKPGAIVNMSYCVVQRGVLPPVPVRDCVFFLANDFFLL